jgi:L-ascorbate metabolism protein UlaG (beta-lactamase superfamily)
MTDPGSFTTEELIIEHFDIVLITHEHADHLHIDSLKKIIVANPEVVIIVNSSVGKLLDEAGIAHQILEGRSEKVFSGIHIQAYDAKHAEIFEEIGQVQNTGYFIAHKLFYGGDAYVNPEREVNVLAFPVGGPWCKVADAIRYVLLVKPKHAFPVHDAVERIDRVHILHRTPGIVLAEHNIDFRPMKAGDTEEL